MGQDNTVVLRVQLSEEDTEKRLAEIAIKLADTRKASTELQKAYKLGQVSAADFGQQSVQLNNELRLTQTEQRNLTKTLDAYRAAQNAQTGSYEQAQRQLDVANQQFQKTAGSQDLSTESAKALSATIAELRGQLTQTDSANQLFVRSVGNYPKGSAGLEELVQQLVQLQEQQKRATAGSEEAMNVTRQIGFVQQAAAQAGAKQGKSFEETTNFIEGLSTAIRPATVQLLDLSEAERAAAESGGQTAEAAQTIGFRMGAAKKQIQDATDALRQEAAAAKTGAKDSQTLGGALQQVAGQNSLLASATEKYTGAKEKFTQVSNLAKLAIGGEATALGVLRVALIATGLGALVVLLGSLVVFLTKTVEGTNLVSSVMTQVGAAVNVVIDRFSAFGKAVTQVLSGDFSGAATTAQATFSGIGDEIKREVAIAGDLSKARQQLDRDTAANIDTNKRLLNEVERLKNVRDNEFNTLAVRKKANEDAYQVELEREKTLADLARRKIAILKQEIDLRGGESKVSLDQLREYKEAQNELSDIQEDAAGKQNELITNRFQLTKDGLDKEKEANEKAADRRIQLRKDALALEAQLIERQVRAVQVGSDQELSLLQQKLRNGYQAELNVKNLTVAQKKVLDAKYENDSLALSLDFNRKRMLAALQAEVDLTAAQLGQQQAGSAEALRLQAEQIEQQRRLALAGLDARGDNEAKTLAINAQAANQQRQLEYTEATRLLGEYLEQKKRVVENDYAQGLIQEGEYQRRLAALAKAGTDAQTIINQDYNQSNTANQKAADEQDTAARRQHTAEVKRQEEVKQEIREATIQAAIAHTDTIINLFGEESQAGRAALAIKKVLGLAEIALNLQKELAANKLAGAQIAAFIPPPAGPILGTAYTIAKDALSITSAAAGAAAILKLQQGGIAQGPTHADGGIPLYHRGRPAGIEIEGGEAVISASATRLFLPLLSAINQAGGGRALTPTLPSYNVAALGAITKPVAMQALRGTAGEPIDYDRLAQALTRVTIYTKTQDTVTALEKHKYTQSLGNS